MSISFPGQRRPAGARGRGEATVLLLHPVGSDAFERGGGSRLLDGRASYGAGHDNLIALLADACAPASPLELRGEDDAVAAFQAARSRQVLVLPARCARPVPSRREAALNLLRPHRSGSTRAPARRVAPDATASPVIAPVLAVAASAAIAVLAYTATLGMPAGSVPGTDRVGPVQAVPGQSSTPGTARGSAAGPARSQQSARGGTTGPSSPSGTAPSSDRRVHAPNGVGTIPGPPIDPKVLGDASAAATPSGSSPSPDGHSVDDTPSTGAGDMNARTGSDSGSSQLPLPTEDPSSGGGQAVTKAGGYPSEPGSRPGRRSGDKTGDRTGARAGARAGAKTSDGPGTTSGDAAPTAGSPTTTTTGTGALTPSSGYGDDASSGPLVLGMSGPATQAFRVFQRAVCFTWMAAVRDPAAVPADPVAVAEPTAGREPGLVDLFCADLLVHTR